jgi:hypothetical protein
MNLELARELWQELKRYIVATDRADAAESVVALMIDHDISADDIKDEFKGDQDIKHALASYFDNDRDYDDEEELFDEDIIDDDF